MLWSAGVWEELEFSVSVYSVPGPVERKISIDCSVALVSLLVIPGVFPKDYVLQSGNTKLKYFYCSAEGGPLFT